MDAGWIIHLLIRWIVDATSVRNHCDWHQLWQNNSPFKSCISIETCWWPWIVWISINDVSTSVVTMWAPKVGAYYTDDDCLSGHLGLPPPIHDSSTPGASHGCLLNNVEHGLCTPRSPGTGWFFWALETKLGYGTQPRLLPARIIKYNVDIHTVGKHWKTNPVYNKPQPRA